MNEQLLTQTTSQKDPYAELGVSSSKAAVHNATKKLNKGLRPGAFCQIFPYFDPLTGLVNPDIGFVGHVDGVGTKSNVAYLAMREGLGDHFFAGCVQDAIVMNIDDIACIGIGGIKAPIYLSNHIERNSARINDTTLATIIDGFSMFCKKMEDLGFDIRLVGGETADVGSYVTTLGLSVTATTFIQMDHVIDCSNIKPKQYIVALASDGRCAYEDWYNSGIRSNGLTLAIKALLKKDYRKYSETMDSARSPDLFYCGKFKLTDELPGSDITVAEAILSPTRTYLPVLKEIAKSGINVSGIIHCTGGGVTKAKNFGKGIIYQMSDILKHQTPPIFQAIQESQNIDESYMYSTFNMGAGMLIFVDSLLDAGEIIRDAKKFGVDAFIVGQTEKAKDSQNRVIIGKNVYTTEK